MSGKGFVEYIAALAFLSSCVHTVPRIRFPVQLITAYYITYTTLNNKLSFLNLFLVLKEELSRENEINLLAFLQNLGLNLDCMSTKPQNTT